MLKQIQITQMTVMYSSSTVCVCDSITCFTDAGIIAGSVVGGFAVVGIAVVMVIIAVYFIVQSSRSKQIARSSWTDTELHDPFAFAKESSLPRFSGSVL